MNNSIDVYENLRDFNDLPKKIKIETYQYLITRKDESSSRYCGLILCTIEGN